MGYPLLKATGKMLEQNVRFLPQLVFEVTEACNLRCEYCAFSNLYLKGVDRNSQKMTFDTAKTILDYLWVIWEEDGIVQNPLRLNIGFYGGEPLMNFPLIERIIDYIKINERRINRHISFSMTTNALLLPFFIEKLVQYDISLLISLDGDEYGDSYRVDRKGNPSYKTVIRNIGLLRDKYPDYYESKVSFNAVLNSRNSYSEIIGFFKTKFGKRPTISPLSVSNLNIKEIERYKTITNKELIDNTCLPMESAPGFMLFMRDFENKSGNSFYDYNSLLFDNERMPTIPTGCCIPFTKKMFVSAKGGISQCEKIDHSLALGHISHGRVRMDYSKAAEIFNAQVLRYEKQCASCSQIRYCVQCAMLGIDDPCPSYSLSCDKNINVGYVSHNLPEAMELFYSTKKTR